MADPLFAKHPSTPDTSAFFTDGGYFWKMTVRRGSFGKVLVKNTAGATLGTNNPGVVPPDAEVFKASDDGKGTKTLEFLGLTAGFTFLTATPPAGQGAETRLQVEVLELPGGKKPVFIAFDGPAVALNAPDTPVPYKLKTTAKVTAGPPETLFDPVPAGSAHVVLSCHGQMSVTGASSELTLFIAGNVGRGNVKDVFAKLKPKAGGGVVWVGGCSAGADNDFCGKAAQASGCFVVAPGITLPAVQVPAGQIEFFGSSMPKVFQPSDGKPIPMSDFLKQQKKLNFHFA